MGDNKSIFEFANKFGYDSPWVENWIPKTESSVNNQWKGLSEINRINKNPIYTKQKGKSKYKILLFGGVDMYNDGSYGSNKILGRYLEIIALSKKYNIPLQKGDIQLVNSPLFSERMDGKDIYNDILNIVKKNFDLKNGTLILYGYSWGGQLLMEFLKFFKESKINIDLLLTIDAAKGLVSFSVNNVVTNNVKNNLNLYQTKLSVIGSRGGPNEGSNVKNVDLTGEKNSQSEKVTHSTIDEYTLLYSAQVIVYALKNIYSFKSRTEQQIKKDIKVYASQGF